ncbi:hypothetical protein PENTCL1PPCAC_22112, partial [Pristionchus entomophagus]
FHDPKYRSFFCRGAHVTELARVLITLQAILLVFRGKFLLILPIPLICLGAFAVYRSSRLYLLVYITISMVVNILWIFIFMVLLSSLSFDRHNLKSGYGIHPPPPISSQ